MSLPMDEAAKGRAGFTKPAVKKAPTKTASKKESPKKKEDKEQS